jgi:hypothetical protein
MVRKTDRISEPPQRTPHKYLVHTETKEEGHFPFLEIDIYRKKDGPLGHRVYRKTTHTNLYLHQNSHHHPANGQSVLASLIHRAEVLVDQDSLNNELEFLISFQQWTQPSADTSL